MKKLSSKFLAVFLILLLLVCAALLFFHFRSSSGCIARIYSDGELLHEIDLSKTEKAYTIDLGSNQILVEPGCISMLSADCRDQICVMQGRICDSSRPIVCMPNKIVIEIASSDGVDAVS